MKEKRKKKMTKKKKKRKRKTKRTCIKNNAVDIQPCDCVCLLPFVKRSLV